MSNATSQEHTIRPEGGQEKSADGLFSPLKIKSITLKNRIAISPMCQYHSVDGFAEDWHLVHLGSRAVGGAGLVVMEASGVEARGRISPDDLGIYKDEHIEKLKQITTFISSFGAVAGIQIAHAGRKASTRNPWKGGNRHEKEYLTSENGGWEIVGPSPLPFSESSTVPKELTIEEIHAIQDSFAAAAKRAYAAGFKWLEVHAAHGYLLRSIPEDRAVLEHAPARLQYWFSEGLESRFTTLTVRNQKGESVATGQVSPDNNALLTARLPRNLPDGAYIVDMRIAFASDGHVVAQSTVFFVGKEVNGVNGKAAANQANPLEVIWRTITLSSTMLLMGVCFLYSTILVPAWGSKAYRAGLLPPRVMQVLNRIMVIGLAAAFIGNILAILQQTMAFFD
ncbi:MAG TPA: copper resistance protein CopC, partial [Candidatus Obscuribacter sp.]|nr:copper resistance protein CopC [Candidatus Obscuribacter sp.]